MYIEENIEYNWIFDRMDFGNFSIDPSVSTKTEVIVKLDNAGELWGGIIVDIHDNLSHRFRKMFPFERGFDLADQEGIDHAVAFLCQRIRDHMMDFGNLWIFTI